MQLDKKNSKSLIKKKSKIKHRQKLQTRLKQQTYLEFFEAANQQQSPALMNPL